MIFYHQRPLAYYTPRQYTVPNAMLIHYNDAPNLSRRSAIASEVSEFDKGSML